NRFIAAEDTPRGLMTTTTNSSSKVTRHSTLTAGIPGATIAMALLAAVVFVLPFVPLLTGITWSDIPTLLTSQSALDALWLSLRTSIVATTICVVLGIPLALVLARTDFPGRTLMRAIVLVPLVIPPV